MKIENLCTLAKCFEDEQKEYELLIPFIDPNHKLQAIRKKNLAKVRKLCIRAIIKQGYISGVDRILIEKLSRLKNGL